MSKPETQRIETNAFDAFGPMASTKQKSKDSIADKLKHLPPFQMFLSETVHKTSVYDESWANRAAQLASETYGESLYEIYAKWHKNKGLWTNETPTGELLEVSDG